MNVRSVVCEVPSLQTTWNRWPLFRAICLCLWMCLQFESRVWLLGTLIKINDLHTRTSLNWSPRFKRLLVFLLCLLTGPPYSAIWARQDDGSSLRPVCNALQQVACCVCSSPANLFPAVRDSHDGMVHTHPFPLHVKCVHAILYIT